MDPEFLDMFIDESSASDYDLFEGAGIEAVNDANIDMPDPDELLEGYLETQIYDETGDEEALKGYDTVIDINEETDTVAPLFSARRDNLDDLNPIYTKCYDTVKAGATRIASGEESLGVPFDKPPRLME